MDLIIGFGNIGRYAAQLFAARGTRIRVAVRSTQKASGQAKAAGADLVAFDFHDQTTWNRALADVDHILFIAPHSDPVPSVANFLEVAAQANVKRIVFSSGRTTGDIPGKPLYEVENTVRGQSIPSIILRPGWFMQNFINWIGSTIRNEGAFYLPIDGASKTAFVDVRDIADVAWTVIHRGGWDGQTLPLTSEEVLDHQQVAEKISAHAGKKIEFVALDPQSYLDKMTSLGWTLAAAKHVVELYAIVKEGKEEETSPYVRQILGRSPYTMDKFFQHHPAELAKLTGLLA